MEDEKALREMSVPAEFQFAIHKEFRLFFATQQSTEFSQTFARKCAKITLEMPNQIKSGAIKSLSSVSHEHYHGGG